jgi:hypothetical protein
MGVVLYRNRKPKTPFAKPFAVARARRQCKLLTGFFFKENHYSERNFGGKETLLLYQARMQKTWQDEPRAHRF